MTDLEIVREVFTLLGIIRPQEGLLMADQDFALGLLRFAPADKDKTVWLARQLHPIYKIPRESLPGFIYEHTS